MLPVPGKHSIGDNMKFSTFKELTKTLVAGKKSRDRYYDSIPIDIRDAIMDNGYTESLAEENTNILALLLPITILDEINWFLYEWNTGDSITVKGDAGSEIVYTINTIEDFFAFIVDNYEFESK